MAGPGVGGNGAGVTGCAVATPGDGSAGSVVTDTTGVGGVGVPAARDVDVGCASASAIAQHVAAIAIIEILVMPLSPSELRSEETVELRSTRYITRARIRSRSPGAI